VEQIRRRFGRGRVVRIIPGEIHEPRGIRALAPIGKRLLEEPRIAGAPLRLRASDRSRSFVGRRFSDAGGGAASPETLASLRGARLIFFGGKGGVGKTTCAAAAALRIARADADARVLLL